jgi:formylglycine-generating enzyme required for sulfatase activity
MRMLQVAIEKEEHASGKPLHRPDGNKAATYARIKPFAIDKYAVSNTQFQKFVRATNYVTEAENFQWSVPCYSNLYVIPTETPNATQDSCIDCSLIFYVLRYVVIPNFFVHLFE